MHTDRIPEDVRRAAINRLRRASGQIDAVARMLEEGEDCMIVLRQLAAGRAAVGRAGVKLLAAGLIECLTDAREGDMVPHDFEKLFMEL